MKVIKGTLLTCIIALPLLNAQSTPKPTSDKELNLQAYEQLLRSDLNAKRDVVFKVIMQLSDSQAQAFWPIVKEYEAERAKLDAIESHIVTDNARNIRAYRTIRLIK